MEAVAKILLQELKPVYEEQNRRIFELENLVVKHERALSAMLDYPDRGFDSMTAAMRVWNEKLTFGNPKP